ncbi:MAG: ATP-binding protein [Candidatus Eisenbacteria bacterium]|nr:ATP-binding protein [Candidatus Eisenbacteria bacterium]
MQLTLERDLEATGELLGFVDSFLDERGIHGKTAFATRLVVEELFANLVRHNRGGAERVEVTLDLSGESLVVRLRDFDVDPADRIPSGPVDVARPLGERTAGGLGLHFVRSFFDSLSYEYSGRTMCVTATKNFRRTDV